MSSINTLEAKKHWDSEVAYLKRIQYVSLETDEETGEKYISILGDEEGNYDSKLTKASAVWMIAELKACIKAMGNKGVSK